MKISSSLTNSLKIKRSPKSALDIIKQVSDMILLNTDKSLHNRIKQKINSLNFDIKKAVVSLPQIDKVSAFLRKMQFYSYIQNQN